MTDREKVLSGLEHCRQGPIGCQQECPYTSDFGCRSQLTADALELLKEQEPIKPVCFEHRRTRNKYQCGNCGSSEIFKEWEYCPWCGRAVKWDEAD